MPNPTKLIDDLIASLTDWRGETFATLRRIIHETDHDVVEEWKWRGAPVWSHDGIICLAVAFKDKVKVTFPQGAHLPDPDKIFNNELEGKQWRAIDLFRGDKINKKALQAMVKSAVAFNQSKAKSAKKSTKKSAD